MEKAIRSIYSEIGVEEYYSNFSNQYFNPHEKIIQKIINQLEQNKLIGNKVLDLCCGSGEVTRYLQDKETIGLDPFTYKIYKEKTQCRCYNYSFNDIVNGKLNEEFDTIICSFALHLCKKSLLYTLLWRLRELSNTLIVISPNKKPNCDNISGWLLVDEFEIERIKTKVYK